MESARELEDLNVFMASRGFVSGRAELIGHGFTDSQIKSWVRRYRLVQVFHGVYSYGRDIETREATWRAALLAAGSGSALTGRSACEAWGMIRLDQPIPAMIEVGGSTRRSVTHQGLSPATRLTTVGVVRRTFESGEVQVRNGLPIEKPPRALIDLAAGASGSDVRFAFLEACRLGLFNRRDVAYSFRRVSGRRGARKLSPLLALWVPELGRIRSVLEGLFLLAWVDAGNTQRMPLVNHKLGRFEVDCLWPGQRLVVELDGDAFHSDPLARARDAAKDHALRAWGFKVMRFDYDAVTNTPRRVVAGVTAALDMA